MGNKPERESTRRDAGSDRNEIDRPLTPHRPPPASSTRSDTGTVSAEHTAVHRSTRTAMIVMGNQITVLQQERILIVSSSGERPQARSAVGCESTCSYGKYGKEMVEQEWLPVPYLLGRR